VTAVAAVVAAESAPVLLDNIAYYNIVQNFISIKIIAKLLSAQIYCCLNTHIWLVSEIPIQKLKLAKNLCDLSKLLLQR